MSIVSVLANNYSTFHKALIFLMRLAWKSRIRLPYLIVIGLMVLDVRLTLEIVVDLEHQTPNDNGTNQVNSDSDDDEDDEEDTESEEQPVRH